MAQIQTVVKVASFCRTSDDIRTSYNPTISVRAPRGSIKEGQLVVFCPEFARHEWKGRFFYGKLLTLEEAGVPDGKLGDNVNLDDVVDNWGLFTG